LDALDGNAIAGPLIDYFGSEMTAETGTCRTCGTDQMVGEVRVYMRAPGAVARCKRCGNVVFVLVATGETLRADLSRFQLHAQPAS
jgi:hypothetical protein